MCGNGFPGSFFCPPHVKKRQWLLGSESLLFDHWGHTFSVSKNSIICSRIILRSTSMQRGRLLGFCLESLKQFFAKTRNKESTVQLAKTTLRPHSMPKRCVACRHEKLWPNLRAQTCVQSKMLMPQETCSPIGLVVVCCSGNWDCSKKSSGYVAVDTSQTPPQNPRH
jgi:hypothetical protein